MLGRQALPLDGNPTQSHAQHSLCPCPRISAADCFTTFMCMQVCKQPNQQLPAIASNSVSVKAYRVSFLQVTVNGTSIYWNHRCAALMLSSLQAYVHELSQANEWWNVYHHSHRQAELQHAWNSNHHFVARHYHLCKPTCI